MPIRQLFFLTVWDEEEIDGVVHRFPELGERVQDWKVIGEIDNSIIVHVITQDLTQAARLYQQFGYLGKSYKAIAQDAKQGDAVCQQVIDEIVFNNWEEDNPDPEGPPRITHRGNLKEWKEKFKPPKLSKWMPAHVWLGQDVETPTDDDVED